jgi:hypothetical protein
LMSACMVKTITTSFPTRQMLRWRL